MTGGPSNMMPARATAYQTASLAIVIGFPLLGAFFPLESYLSAATVENPGSATVESTGATTFILAGLLANIVYLYLRSPHVISALVLRNWPLLLFVGWAFLTSFWSENQVYSMNRTGRMLISLLYGVYICERYGKDDFYRIVIFAILLGLVASLLVTIFVPGLSRVTDLRGAWRGAYAHKNNLGAVAALGILFAFLSPARRVVGTPLFALLACGSVIAMLAANSVSPLVAVSIGIALSVYFRVAATGGQLDRLIALVGAALLAVLAAGLSQVLASNLEFLGRDSTLTGRTAIWDFADMMIGIKPLLGWGHGAWNDPGFQKVVLSRLGWPSPHAHNVWLDIRLQLGLPGLVFAIFMSGLAAFRCVKLVMWAVTTEHLLWIACLVYLSLRSYSETILVDPAVVEMFGFSVVFARLSRLSAEISHVPGRTVSNHPGTERARTLS